MPVDTQPLSRTRRLLLLAVLLLLFMGSIGFAEYLVLRRQHKQGFTVAIDSYGFTTPEAETMTDEVLARAGTVAGHSREVRVFAIATPQESSLQQQLEVAEDLFSAINQAPPSESMLSRMLDRPAVQVVGVNGHGRFTILRFTVVGNQSFAISYSGPGAYTDADKEVYNAICAHGIRITH